MTSSKAYPKDPSIKSDCSETVGRSQCKVSYHNGNWRNVSPSTVTCLKSSPILFCISANQEPLGGQPIAYKVGMEETAFPLAGSSSSNCYSEVFWISIRKIQLVIMVNVQWSTCPLWIYLNPFFRLSELVPLYLLLPMHCVKKYLTGYDPSPYLLHSPTWSTKCLCVKYPSVEWEE